jgi:hypothetical protein
MTEDIIQELSLNKILVAILEEHGPISVPTLKFLDAASQDKELVVEYDDETLSFKFNVRGKDDNGGNDN